MGHAPPNLRKYPPLQWTSVIVLAPALKITSLSLKATTKITESWPSVRGWFSLMCPARRRIA